LDFTSGKNPAKTREKKEISCRTIEISPVRKKLDCAKALTAKLKPTMRSKINGLLVNFFAKQNMQLNQCVTALSDFTSPFALKRGAL
jgi:hypothetical protein